LSQEATPDSIVDNMAQRMTNQASTNTVVNSPGQADDVTESPLTGEALLKRPELSSVQPEMLQSTLAHAPSFNRSLATLLNTSLAPTSLAAVEEQQVAVPDITAQATQATQQELETPLSAVRLGDNNVPDGQVFPPGAEYIKSWRMLNNGSRAWPETTVLELVVGESFASDRQAAVKVGSVAPGAVIDLWSAEMKAPETSGKYVSYWRLNDGKGNLFGHSIWIDITVAEQSKSTDSSLASSSIIMPQSAPAKSSVSSGTGMVIEGPPATSTSPAIASLPQTDDTVSDDGSDGSSVSLISVPSSDDDDDPAIWEDSRSHVVLLPPADRARAAMEYVVLYDDSSSSSSDEA